MLVRVMHGERVHRARGFVLSVPASLLYRLDKSLLFSFPRKNRLGGLK